MGKRPGDHDKREITKSRILLNVILGNTTRDGIRASMTHRMATDFSRMIAEFIHSADVEGIEDPALVKYKMDDWRREIKAEHDHDVVSNKDVYYHLSDPRYGLISRKLIIEKHGNYQINWQVKSKALEVLGMLTRLPELNGMFERLFDEWALKQLMYPSYIVRKGSETTKLFILDLWKYILEDPLRLTEFILAYIKGGRFNTEQHLYDQFMDFVIKTGTPTAV